MEQMNTVLETSLSTVKKEIDGYKTFELPEKINTNKDHKLASDATKYLNDKLKVIEAARKMLVQPLTDESKKINSAFKTLSNPLEALATEIKEKLLDYTKRKMAEQAEYEEQKRLANPGQDELVVDDKVAKIKEGEVSSNYLKKTTNYQVKDAALRAAIVVKKEALEAYLENNKLPDWLEAYEVESIVVRTK